MGFEYINAGRLDGYMGASGVVIIDLREPEQYAAAHFSGAINVPYRQMEKLLDNSGYNNAGNDNGEYNRNGYGRGGYNRSGSLVINGNTYDRSTFFIFYCERGSLSMIIGSRMSSMGYDARTVVGGIRQYRGRNMVR